MRSVDENDVGLLDDVAIVRKNTPDKWVLGRVQRMRNSERAVSDYKNPVSLKDIKKYPKLYLVVNSICFRRPSFPHSGVIEVWKYRAHRACKTWGYGWRDYDVQFRLTQMRYPYRAWGFIDQELWTLCILSPVSHGLPSHAGREGSHNFQSSGQRRGGKSG